MKHIFPLLVVACAILVLPVSNAAPISEIQAGGESSGYRVVNLTWELGAPASDGDIFYILVNESSFSEMSDTQIYSTVFVSSTDGLEQPSLGEWYDDCQSHTGDGNWQPSHRSDNGSAVVPIGTLAVKCGLTGMPVGEDVFFAVLPVDGQQIHGDLSEVVMGTSTGIDELPPATDTRPVWFAIGSIALSLVVLLGVLGWKERTAQGRTAMAYVAPALLALALLTFYPVGYGIVLSFTDANHSALGEESFNGVENYIEVFTSAGFLRVLGFTLLWTVVNVFAHVGIGLALAMALQGKVKGKVAYRTVLLLPWAIPSYISVLIWRGIF